MLYYDEYNKRIKIKNNQELTSSNLIEIKKYAKEVGAGKIIAYCKSENWEPYIENGFVIEGVIGNFFSGKAALCMSYFEDKKRSKIKNINEKNKIIKACGLKDNTFKPPKENLDYQIRDAVEKDAKEMAVLFERGFKTYPTPMFDEEYIIKKIKENVIYKLAIHNEEIIGVASAEMDIENHNAEITDCIINPSHESKGVITNLVYYLEKDLKKRGFIGLYSLARASIYGINMVFEKHNYRYSGRMINNCNICGGFEDMNIWEKSIF